MDKNNNLLTKLNLRDNFMRYLSLVALIVLCIAFSIAQNHFLGQANLKNLLSDSAPLMIMAAGMTSVLLLGSIDLSMGAVCSVSNVLTVLILNNYGPSLGSPVLAGIFALIVAVAFGMGAGLLLGFIHVRFKVPSFIASLGFMALWGSVALLITAAPVSILKAEQPSVAWFKTIFNLFGVVPLGLPLIIAFVWIFVVFFLQTRTGFGRSIYAIGGNERAARIAGLDVTRTKILVFVLSGVCAALGGYFLAGKLGSSAPTVGDPFTLLIVAAVALGGTSLIGGKGGVIGTLIGVFTVSVIQNGMNFVGVSAYWQNIVFGIFILGAIAVSINRSERGFIVK